MRPALAALVLIPLLAAVPVAPSASAAPSPYLEDFDFVRETVQKDGAAPAAKKIDWKAECARLRPAFAECRDDVEHVKNVMRLLATLRDSHTGVTSSKVDGKQLPSKWDGLYGAGLWIGWDRGWLVVQGLMDGHPLASQLPAGSAIAAIDGEPAWLAMERERRRIAEFQGISTDHSLFASMDNRLLPFGEKQTVELLVLTPEGKDRKVRAPRWGPGGRAFSPASATMPDGLEWKEGAVAKMLSTPWCPKLGYVRITGSMDDATQQAFFAAFDTLQGMEACLLDCRGMGGGSDLNAWAMAGRFFPKGASNGRNGRIEPTGAWQFDGPVVMLQDSQEVSSAETFTWAMSETERVISVGRATGGWGIIPHGYSCPSGLVSFRLGVNDRPTPIRGVHTEGVGWPPDVEIPRGPVLRSVADPEKEIALEVLHVLHAGGKTDRVRDAFAGLVAGRTAEFAKTAPKLADAKGFAAARLADRVRDDLERRLAMETALLGLDDAGPPDVLGARARLDDLAPRATAAGLKTQLTRFQQAVAKLAKEGAAQEAFLAMTDRSLRAPEKDRKAFLAAHKGTSIAKFAAERLWK